MKRLRDRSYSSSTLRVSESAYCECCHHAACAALKQQQWCRHWFFLRWETDWVVMPSTMLEELRSKLAGAKFRFCAIRTVIERSTVFEILVKVDSDEGFGPVRALLASPPGSVVGERSQVWPLLCCWYSLKWDAIVWIESMSGLLLGDGRLCSELERSVREAAGEGELEQGEI
ncbi:hypothetical protein VFPBJ_11763 [Purpureocillium lilacinum]|uniref:Uncharacterized protein n=1 Tax=Purpureocillium lilacinum TaxID=33203 RepID=A0A179EVS1_PURLI|nr:hypothetical protein VFPBJ_11763 [Purpureocillium lilacinum]